MSHYIGKWIWILIVDHSNVNRTCLLLRKRQKTSSQKFSIFHLCTNRSLILPNLTMNVTPLTWIVVKSSMDVLMAQFLEQFEPFKSRPTVVDEDIPKDRIHCSHASRNETVSRKLAPFTPKSVTISHLINLGFWVSVST